MGVLFFLFLADVMLVYEFLFCVIGMIYVVGRSLMLTNKYVVSIIFSGLHFE